MANGSAGPAATARSVLAGTLGTIAAFVLLFGVGLQRWAIIALGAALLVLAVALVAFPAMRGGGRNWIAGSAHVVNASEAPPSSTYGRCELQIVIEAPGLPAAAVKIRDPRVPVAKWPYPGTTLPIIVDADDPRHVRIQWDDVPTHSEAAAQEYGETLADLADIDVPRADGTVDDGVRGGTLDLGDEVADLRAEERDAEERDAEERSDGERSDGERVVEEPGRERMVVRETPDGTIIDFIKDPPVPQQLPRRATTGPGEPSAADAGRETGGVGPAGPESVRPEPGGPEASDRESDDPVSSRPDNGGPPVGVPRQRRKPSPYRRRGQTQAAATAATAAARAAAATATEPPPGDATTGQSAAAKPRTPTAGPTDDLGDLITAYPSARPSPTGAIHGVGITVLVTDLGRSVAFYRDMLGFYEIDGGDDTAMLASGDTRLVLHAARDGAKVSRRTVHINLEVGDVEATYEDLKAKGVRFTYAPRVVNRGTKLEQWAAVFRDPDGHGVTITQWRGRAD